MAKKTAKTQPGAAPIVEPVAKSTIVSKPEPKPEVTTPSAIISRAALADPTEFDRAVAEGLALIRDGKSKADAARLIYDMLKTEPKDVIVAAFVFGATLTEKGALTYWYNCKRRAKKEAGKPNS